MKFYCEECFEEMGNCLDDCKAAERDKRGTAGGPCVCATGDAACIRTIAKRA